MMSRRGGLLACLVPGLALGLAGQQQPEELRLPSGKLQKEEILKAEHQNSLRDAAQIIKLAEALKAELEKNDYHVVSLASIKKTEEIERLARRIKSRLRRY